MQGSGLELIENATAETSLVPVATEATYRTVWQGDAAET
jgi:hypothetical protein